MTSRQAPLKIDFLVVGGGIAGLSTAYALAAAGHRARVLEQSTGDSKLSGGVQVPPNLTKILVKWGLEQELKAKCSPIRGTYTMYLDTGERFGYLPWAEEVQSESGAPFYTMQHRDLHDMLRRLALSAGVQIIPNASVVSVSPPPDDIDEDDAENDDTNPPLSSVSLSDGRILYADVIVGADGQFSVVRRCIQDEFRPPIQPRWDGNIDFVGVLPMEEMVNDDDLKDDAIRLGWPMWCGSNNAVFGYPIMKDQEYAVHIWFESPTPDGIPEGWTPRLSPDYFRHNVEKIDRGLASLMSKLTSVGWVRRLEWPKLEDWVDDSGYIVLVGDAARPSKPGATHAASAAVEAGAVLGTLFSYLRTYDQISTLLYAYQDLRQERTQDLEDVDEVNGAFRLMPAGPERDVRDEHMMLSLAVVGREVWEVDENLSKQWWQNYMVWAYNAFDAAEDWWIQWGALKERSLMGGDMDTGFQFAQLEVTVGNSPTSTRYHHDEKDEDEERYQGRYEYEEPQNVLPMFARAQTIVVTHE